MPSRRRAIRPEVRALEGRVCLSGGASAWAAGAYSGNRGALRVVVPGGLGGQSGGGGAHHGSNAQAARPFQLALRLAGPGGPGQGGLRLQGAFVGPRGAGRVALGPGLFVAAARAAHR